MAECNGGVNQKFEMNWHKDLRVMSAGGKTCLDISARGEKVPIYAFMCHNMKGNQLFKYDVVST